MLRRAASTIGLSLLTLIFVGLVAAEDVVDLVKQLKSKDELVRLKAAKELGKLGAKAKSAIPALTEALKDDDEDVRGVARRAITAIEGAANANARDKVVADLEDQVKAAKDKKKEVREAVALRLAKLLDDSDEIVRLKAARTLSEMGIDAQGAGKALSAAAKDQDAAVRKMARKALDRIAELVAEQEAEQQRAMLEPLLKELKSSDAKKRYKAVEQIAEMGPKAAEAGQALVEAMMDKNPAIRNKASEALEAVDSQIHQHVVTLFIGQGKEQALNAIAAMGTRGKAALPVVLQLVSMDPGFDFALPTAALHTIRKIAPDDKRVTRTILALVSQGPSVAFQKRMGFRTGPFRLQAVKYLDEMEISAKEKVPALLAALNDQYCIIAAIQSLGKMGPDASGALPTLRQLRNSNLDAVRQAATDAVRSIEK